jgi:hypothetical protein
MLLFCNCELSHSQQKSARKPLPSLSFPKFQQLFSVIEKGITLADGTDQGASSLLSILTFKKNPSSLNKPRLTFCLLSLSEKGFPSQRRSKKVDTPAERAPFCDLTNNSDSPIAGFVPGKPCSPSRLKRTQGKKGSDSPQQDGEEVLRSQVGELDCRRLCAGDEAGSHLAFLGVSFRFDVVLAV